MQLTGCDAIRQLLLQPSRAELPPIHEDDTLKARQHQQDVQSFGVYYLEDVSVLYFVLDGVIVRHNSAHDGKPAEQQEERKTAVAGC